MYSQFLSTHPFSPIGQGEESSVPPPPRPGQPAPGPSAGGAEELTGSLQGLLGGVMRQFSLEKLDTGDILLVLILLFLFMEGDNLELVITLGLLLLMGLGED